MYAAISLVNILNSTIIEFEEYIYKIYYDQFIDNNLNLALKKYNRCYF